MTKFIEVDGVLFSADNQIIAVDKVRPREWDETRYCVDIKAACYGNEVWHSQEYNNEEDAEAFRTEFIEKMCN